MTALTDYQEEFESMGATLVAISGEPVDRTLELVEADSLTFTVLSDTSLVASRKFGVVYELPQVIQDVIIKLGFDMAAYYGIEKAEIPLSATYVIDQSGKITYAFLEEN